MTRQPIVSIVMPTYDRLEFLPSTVHSICSQTFQDWELIVADDGSDERVLKYLCTLQRDPRVRVLRREHSGKPGAVRNAAIAVARAPFVAFADSDDLWAPVKLERQLATLRGQPECHWSYTAFVLVDGQDRPLVSEHDRPWTPYSGYIFSEVVRGVASIRTPSVIAYTELVGEVGAFDETIDCGEDYDLWMRLALRSPACVIDEPLVRVRRYRGIDEDKIARAHIARDYSLHKLAQQVPDIPRAVLSEERSCNALAQAAVIAAHGARWRALATVARSLPFSWKYPRWWYGAAKALARACLPAPKPARRRRDHTATL